MIVALLACWQAGAARKAADSWYLHQEDGSVKICLSLRSTSPVGWIQSSHLSHLMALRFVYRGYADGFWAISGEKLPVLRRSPGFLGSHGALLRFRAMCQAHNLR